MLFKTMIISLYPMADNKLTSVLPQHHAGLRLDKALAELFADYSRSFLQRCLNEGLIRINGHTAQASDKVCGGEEVCFEVPQFESATLKSEALPLDLIYEDEHFIVVNKHAGVVVHPAAGHRSGTLLNALLHHCAALEALPRCGIVHRLDKDTSGLLAVAKTHQAHFDLIKQLQNREMGRHYIALAWGQFISGGSIDAPIGRHPSDRLRRAVVHSGGKSAVTHFRIARKYPSHTRLHIALQSGRTHQIRVHLAHIHHPLFGDALYGGRYRPIKGWSQQHLQQLRHFNRQALHASHLHLKHPYSGEMCRYQAELPADMKALFALFDEYAKTPSKP